MTAAPPRPEVPSHYRLQYSEEQIKSSVRRIGDEITVWAREVRDSTGSDLLAVPVLRGGIYFFSDLTRHIAASIEVAPGRTRAYEVGQNAVQRSEVRVSIEDVEFTDRNVLLVDDICDSGRTLKVLREHILEHGAAEVRSAVLIKRVLENAVFRPTWMAFEYQGPEWFVGYGMEDSNHWSNLPEIFTIEQTEEV